MGESDAFTLPGSSQQQFQHTYNLWESSAYYNINDLSARNLLVQEVTDGQPSSCSKFQEKELERDSKNRRVVSKQSLYDQNNLPTRKVENSSEPNDTVKTANSWTAHYWKKPTLGHGQAQRNSKHNAKPNRIQNILNKALAQPLKIDKAASMMAKMGWEGGALGKSGVGIVEPIAPNTDYALTTTGFGKPEPKPKPPKLVKQQNGQRRGVTFKMNVLLQILDFVKNDYEVEMMFEAKLQNGERKKIHHLVEKISNEVYGDDIEENSMIEEILKYNQSYVLRTISEGVRPNRTLCLFKEAPDHLYLVTHLDLRYDPEDTDETEKQTEEMDIDIIDFTNDSDVDLPTKSDEATELKECKTNDIANVTVNETEVVKSKSNETSNNGEDKNITKSNESKTNPDIISKKIRTGPVNKHKKGRAKRPPKPKIEPKPRKITKRESKFSKVTENTLKQETNPFMKSILSVQTDVHSTERVLTKTDLRNQILEYFDEFAKHDLYTEFKFLGPFEGIEVEAINEFIGDLWSCLTNSDCPDHQIASVVKDSKCGIAITTDANGSALIYKTKMEESGT